MSRFKGLLSLAALLIFSNISLAQTVNALNEGFNNSASIPSGWTQETVTGTDVWTINNGGYYDNGQNNPSAAHSGNRNAYLFSLATTRKLVTPKLNLGGLTGIQLKFWEARMKFGADFDNLKVYYKTSSTGSWTLLQTYSTATTGWVQRTISLPNPSPNYYIAFEGIAKYGYGVCIDDVDISGTIGNDAQPTVVLVQNKKDVYVTIKNNGSLSLTSAKINFSVNGGSTNTYSWSGTLTTGNSTTIKAGSFSFPDGVNSIKVWTSNPNNGDDAVNANDTLIVPYKLVSSFPYTESFENVNLGYWTNSITDDMNWTRLKGKSATANTGPANAHNGDYYMYTESSGYYNKKAELISIDYDISKVTNPYLEVWYHMYGTSIGSLSFDVDSAGTWVNDIVQTISGNQGNTWYKQVIPLSRYKNLNKLKIRAVTGTSFLSDIAVDDIKLIDVPSFTFGKDIIKCIGDSFTMTIDTGWGYKFLWKKVGLTDTLSLTNELKVKSSGDYCLLITAPYGYSATDTVNVSFAPVPVASFSVSDTDMCFSGNQFNYTNLSSIASGKMNYLWQFGDNDTSASSSPSHKFMGYGSYNTSLIVSSEYGCSDTFQTQITVHPQPVASFAINDTDQCFSGNIFNFTNKSNIAKGKNVSYDWTFGDSGNSAIENPSYQYLKADSFKVILKVSSDKGCKDSIGKTIIVFPMPVATFVVNISGQCLMDNAFNFTNNSTISSGSMSYLWNFGDNVTTTNTNSSHSYSKVGVFKVSLFATSNHNCKDTSEVQTETYPMPVASFTINDTVQCFKGNRFEFTDHSVISTGNIKTWKWSFGQGAQDTGKFVVKNYLTEGIFQVKVLVASDKGCKDSVLHYVYADPMPVSIFSVNDTVQCFNDHLFKFSNKSTISKGSLNYLWKFGDNVNSSLTDPTHIYPVDSTFQVSLITWSDKGCYDTSKLFVTTASEPISNFLINKKSQCLTGNLFLFTNSSYVKVGTMTYDYAFGDGTNSNIEKPIHNYKNADTFKVTLIVKTDNFCYDTLQKEVYVRPNPKANFSIDDVTQCLNGNLFNFHDSSMVKYGKLSHYWTFGDGEFSDSISPVKSYILSGRYKVNLKITSDYSCKDSIFKYVDIFAQPNVSIGNNDTISDKDSIILDAGSGFISYLWQDGSTSQTFLVKGDSFGIGDHLFFVEVIDSNSCINSDSVLIHVEHVGIDEQERFYVKTYPNPVSGKVYIEFPDFIQGMVYIEILDFSGKLIQRESLSNIENKTPVEISLPQIAQGICFIRIITEKKTSINKILIIKP